MSVLTALGHVADQLHLSRRRLLVGAVVTLNAVVVAMAWTAPAPRPPMDPENGPFIGPGDVSAWLAPVDPLMYGGRVRAHRVWVVLTAAAAVLLSVGSVVANRRRSSRSPPWCAPPKATLDFRQGGAKAVAVLLILITLISIGNMWRTPSFASCDARDLHIALNHYDLLAPADHVAAGDRLLVDVLPSYGALWPIVMGAYQKWFGLVSLGTIIQILLQTNALFMLIFTATLYRWARGRMTGWVPPLVLTLGYYVSVQNFLVPPNHCMIRVAALAAAPAAWLSAVRMSPARGAFVLGMVAALALTNNFETGIAVAAGTMVVGFFRWFLPAITTSPSRAMVCLCAYGGGLFVVVAGIEAFAIVALGQFLPLPGLILPSVYAASSSGPFLTYPPANWVVPMIVLMLLHAAVLLLDVASLTNRGGRHAVRAGVCTALLIWMAYPVNRPHTEYMYSVYLPYAFLLIDAIRTLRLAWMSRGGSRSALPAGWALLWVAAFTCVWIQMRADRGRFWSDRWQLPLVRSTDRSRLVSGVMLSDASREEEMARAAFLEKKVAERGNRLVFISHDAFLISRLANTVAAQPYSEPGMCVSKRMYRDYLAQAERLAGGELYIDSRCTPSAIWSGFVNDMARRNISESFEMIGHEGGWEIWRERSEHSPSGD